MECIDCHRPLRHRKTPAADAPGTRKAQPGPRCPDCYATAPRMGKQKAINCKGCERDLRPSSVTLVERPNTVVHKGNGFCATCWRADKGLTKYRRGTRPDTCIDCHSAMRPQHTTVEQYPGTVLYNCGGRCAGCYKKKRRAEARKPKPVYDKKCTGCDHPLRPKDRPETEFPGTLPYAGKGMCNSCYAHDRRGTTKVRAVPLEPVPDAALTRFEVQRQERIRRQQQVQRVRVAQEAARRRFIQSRRAA